MLPFIAMKKSLQKYLAKCLTRQGIPHLTELGFRNNNCRADIVTVDAIIEIKLHLNRSQLYMAYGQVSLYQKLSIQEGFPIPWLWIIGQRPQNDADYEGAKRLAQTIVSTTSKCTVTFLKLSINPGINLDQQFFTFPRKPLNAPVDECHHDCHNNKIGCQEPDF